METGYAVLTVCYEDPFWVGLYQRSSGEAWEVCKITFGAEPRDSQVYAWLLENWRRLDFRPAGGEMPRQDAAANPKRRQRQIQRAVKPGGMGTKAQQALKLQQAQGKEARKRRSRQEREAEQARQFALRREKQKRRHKGR